MDWVAAVREFNEKFGVPISDAATSGELDRRILRCRLIEEEFDEFTKACSCENLVEMADGLADLLYVTIGAALEFGIPIDRVFAEVHRSNMTKLGPDGRPRLRADGKILKPDTYSPPDVAACLR